MCALGRDREYWFVFARSLILCAACWQVGRFSAEKAQLELRAAEASVWNAHAGLAQAQAALATAERSEESRCVWICACAHQRG